MWKLITLVFGCAVLLGFLFPEENHIPVVGASVNDWHRDTFWFEPWGTSGVHKGIDIFADRGAQVVAPTGLILLYRGELSKGGNVILALGPKWRLHYFAHLHTIDRRAGVLLSSNEVIGEVGDTGNAIGKQPHLHYSIVSLIPYPWLADGSSQGYKKAFYLDPGKYLNTR
ncbi:M23 family metallopeptidase [Teredinibacter sp. KSP-S5-2]|uniref:M23 family metallopeptidase n=1 Tax=Teredinibacter sp. KSP-S5-2 TaxID=3034506 RepID=UPI002934DD90|nr:M23 family metallopeptidase [Teredinibacter sp. KSP-S5-2]WNO10832.1 M23 family metallopeptidase [Teredinibacter sp. KSP-S5-2]